MMLDIACVVWICGLAARGGLATIVHYIRQRKRRRDAHLLYEIPNLRRRTSDPDAGPDSRFEVDWLEIHPLPRRIRKNDVRIKDDSDLEELAKTYLDGFPPDRVRAILAEARRTRARLSSTHWCAEKARKGGQLYWIRSAISYAGED